MSQPTENAAPPEASSDWIELSEIAETGMTVKLLRSGKKAVLFRRGKEVRAYHEVCPHMGADLSEGVVCSKERTLACKWHGYVYSTDDGTLLDNPNERLAPLLRKPSKHFRPEKTPQYRLRLVPFTMKGTRVYLGTADERTADDR